MKRNNCGSPVKSFSDLTNDLQSQLDVHKSSRDVLGAPGPHFIGMPDYLAPKVVLGYGREDRGVDWVGFPHAQCYCPSLTN